MSIASDRQGGATKEQTERGIVGPFVDPLYEGLGMHCAKQRTAAAIDNRDHNLHGAGRVEHDPILLTTIVADLHELACAYRLHTWSVLLDN